MDDLYDFKYKNEQRIILFKYSENILYTNNKKITLLNIYGFNII